MPALDITNLTFQELVGALRSLHQPPFRARQIFQWIYQKGVWSFDDMKNLPGSLRDKLNQAFVLKRPQIRTKKISKDGTVKFLLDLEDHHTIETVLIPTAKRTTVCVSTQVGCKFGCRFCASGLGGWQRHLSCAEMVGQVLLARDEARRYAKPLSHVVYMGTGEPFDNFESVMRSIGLLNDSHGLRIAARRVTVSTCGVIPGIKRLAQQGLQVELAISLHGYNQTSRDILMPVNKKYPFEALIEACRQYTRETRRQVTFEYILIKNLTCSRQAAQGLRRALKGIICKMNLIAYNPVKAFDYQPPEYAEILLFKKQLEDNGIHATIRRARARDIHGACGQLRGISRITE